MLDFFLNTVASFYIPTSNKERCHFIFKPYMSLYVSVSILIDSHLKECSIVSHFGFDWNSFLEHLTCLCIHSWTCLYIICHQCIILGRCSVNFCSLGSVSIMIAECEDSSYILDNGTLWNIWCENISSLDKLSFFCSMSSDTEILI